MRQMTHAKVRPSQERGHANLGWLDSRHSFSFGQYFDPEHTGFGALRVINEDNVVAGAGFDTHGHKDMEIISYVLDGALEHKDSLGTGSVIKAGDVQRMTAGTGVRHSEFNASKTDPVHFLQIWIVPEKDGLTPSYEEKTFTQDERRNTLRLIGSRTGRNGSLTIHQDVDLFGSLLDRDQEVDFDLQAGRKAWMQVARGSITVDGERLNAGDGFGILEAGRLKIAGLADAEFLLFDLAG